MAQSEYSPIRKLSVFAAAVVCAAGLFLMACAALLQHQFALTTPIDLWLREEMNPELLLSLAFKSRYELTAIAVLCLFVAGLVVRAFLPTVDNRGQASIPVMSQASFAINAPDSEHNDHADQNHPADQDQSTAVADYGNNADISHAALVKRLGNTDTQLNIATSELTRLRKELVQSRQELENAELTTAEFLSTASHKLRTPINGIVGLSELLLKGKLNESDSQHVRTIYGSANTLSTVVNDLLDLTKLKSGDLQLEHGRFSIRDCVESVCSNHANNAHTRDTELVCHVDENVPTFVDGDGNRLRQILDNLISNAIKHTDKGEVVVRLARTHEEGERLSFHCDVQDTGDGISPEIQAELYSLMAGSSVDNSSSGGMGTGLFIAQQLISLMGGNITFRSRLDEGSQFSFDFSCDQVVGDLESEPYQRVLHGARVLVVDDNKTNRTILRHQLINQGMIVETVAGGAAALELMQAVYDRNEAFDVLVLDLHMPEMDGIELATQIQQNPDLAGIKSLMLTSSIFALDRNQLEAIGIHKYISKPARQSVMLQSLASLLPGNLADGSQVDQATSDAEGIKLQANILLVEDNPVNQAVAAGILEQLGCEVTIAVDGQKAVDMSQQHKFDLIFMDCQMPVMDGYEATGHIKSSNSSLNLTTPIVALTANALDGDRERCIDSGMDDYLSKPISSESLSGVISNWTDSDSTPDTRPDTTPDTTPDKTTESVQNSVPDSAPDLAPESIADADKTQDMNHSADMTMSMSATLDGTDLDLDIGAESPPRKRA